MDLSLLFSPLDEALYKRNADGGSMLHALRVFGEKMPNYKEADIAMFGIAEERGHKANHGCAKAPDEIRRKLYALKQSNLGYNVVDLGNLNTGDDVEATYTRVGEVCRLLMKHNVIPVLLGGSHDLDYGQHLGYEELEKMVSALSVDAFLDLDNGPQAEPAARHIRKILLHEPNYLMDYTHLAHQAYLTDMADIDFLEKLYFETYRVGQLRGQAEELEPAVRGADMISFDITAIRSTDAPGNACAQPFGLTAEEACQICWYAGLNEKLSSIGFYEYNPGRDDRQKKTASVLAAMVWYFIEGYYHRKNRKSFSENDFVKYTVSLPASPDMLTFYRSKWTEKWWMETPDSDVRRTYGRMRIIPCSYKDYQDAAHGDLPARYLLALSKQSPRS